MLQEAENPDHPRAFPSVRGHHIARHHVIAEIDRRIGVLEIAPALMRALGPGMGEDQDRVDEDRDAPALGFAEAEDRRARDQLMLENPVERALAGNLRMPLGQIARGQENRAGLGADEQRSARCSTPVVPNATLVI